MIIGVVFAFATAAWLTSSGADQRPGGLRDFMVVKLAHSQKVLEGLVVEDFDAIAKNADNMRLLSLDETWQVLTTPDYLEFSRKFRAACEALGDAARKKNLEKSTAAFNQMTVKCVECHKYVRGVRMARQEQGPGFDRAVAGTGD
jgi:hypothetical protein